MIVHEQNRWHVAHHSERIDALSDARCEDVTSQSARREEGRRAIDRCSSSKKRSAFHTVAAHVVLATLFTLVSPARAHTQWEWLAVEAKDPAGIWYLGGSPEVFTTKEEALAVFHNGTPTMDLITVPAGIERADSNGIVYRFVAPPASPALGAWLYYKSIYDSYPAYGGGPHMSFSTEEDALTAVVAQYGSSCYPTAEFVGDWNVGQMINRWHEQQRPTKLRKASLPYCTGPELSATTYSIFRERQVSCPAGYWGYSGYQEPERFYECNHTVTAYVRGRPLECSNSGPSTDVGNPCNVATGDKSQQETDYVAPGLAFTRSYHSAAPSADHSLGAHWTHNYAGRLLLDDIEPVVLIRSNGYHDILESLAGEYRSLSNAGTRLIKTGTEWTVRLSGGGSEVYDGSGALLRVSDSAGLTTNLYYSTDPTNSNSQLTSVVGPFGHRIDFSYDSSMRIAAILDSDGQTIQYTYDPNGNLQRVTFQDETYRDYLYEDLRFPHHLTGIVDESGSRLSTYSYDSMGRAEVSERANGVGRVELTYESNSTIVLDAAGAQTVYEFTSGEGGRRVTSVTRAGLRTDFELEPDAPRRVVRSVDPSGITREYTYDSARLTSVTEASSTPNERTRTFTYLSPLEDLITVEQLSTPTLGTVLEISTVYDENRRPTVMTTTGPDGGGGSISRTATISYTNTGQVRSVDGPRTDADDITTYTYHDCITGAECGQVHTITNALGHVTTYTSYNAHGQVLTFTDPNGTPTVLTYDLRQRIASRSVGSEATSFDYWPTGLLRRVTLPNGTYLQYDYDTAHRLINITDSEGNRIRYTLDSIGNRVGVEVLDTSNAISRVHTQVFNMLNQLQADIGSAGTASVTTSFEYDDRGNLITVDAPSGRSTTRAYDELDRLTTITDAADGTTQYGYNALDQLIAVTDPRNLTTSYTRNALGDLEQVVSPDTGTRTQTFDSAGNVKTSTDARGAMAAYTYDALNRVTTASFEMDGSVDQVITYAYDDGPNGVGRMSSAADSMHSTTWTYDTVGRVLTKAQRIGPSSKSVSYTYANGDMTSLRTPSGQIIDYSYSNGKVTGVAVNGTVILSNALYEPFGPIRQWTWGNGTLAVRTYDADGKIAQIESAGLRIYDYDDASRLTSITDPDSPSNSWVYGYDALDRLTSATAAGGTSLSYSYDPNGNRLTRSGASTSSYDIAPTSNRLMSISGEQARTYSYDAAGHVTGYGSVVITYNSRGRMKSLKNGNAAAVHYIYNAQGQLVQKSNGATFVYDEAGHVLGQYSNAGALNSEYVWLGDLPVAVLRPKSGGGVDVFYIHTDHLNTPRRVTRPSDSKLLWQWNPDPFGDGAPDENPESLGTFTFHLRFPGQMRFKEAGLYYNHFRDYDPATGRYIQSDPIGLLDGPNTYAYVRNRPTMGIDAFGLAYQNPLGGPCPLLTYPEHCEFVPDSNKVHEIRSDERRRIEEGSLTWEGELPGWQPGQDLPSPLSIRRRIMPNPGLQIEPTGDPSRTHGFRVVHRWGRYEVKYESVQYGRCKCFEACGKITWLQGAEKRSEFWREDGKWDEWEGW